MAIGNDNFKHLNIECIQQLIDDLNKDHGTKMLRLNEVFIKIYEVLVDNNIDKHVFNDMKCTWVTANHFQYTVNEKNHTFTIHLHLEKTKKVKPYGRLVIKNNKTQFVIEEMLKTNEFNHALPPKFIMYFQNAFPRYYRTLQFRPQVCED